MSDLNKWINKYKPLKVSEIVCNKKGTNTIISWLKNFEKNKEKYLIENQTKKRKRKKNSGDGSRSCLYVKGKHGVGKSAIVRVILKELGYDEINLNYKQISKSKKREDFDLIFNCQNIFNVMSKKRRRRGKEIIILDELEFITSSKEKSYLLSLLKSNDQNWHCPIIFISNLQHNKFLNELAKNTLLVKFYSPWESEMKTLLKRICKKEGIRLSSVRVERKLIDHCQSDMRVLINTLEILKSTMDDKVLTLDKVKEYCLTSQKKDIDILLFDATSELLFKYRSIDDCLRLYETDKTALPLMFHHNYLPCIIENVPGEDRVLDLVETISDEISMGDVIENYIYGEQNWHMQEIQGFLMCAATSFHLKENLSKNPIKISPTYTQDFNKTSIMNINKRNINNTKNCLKNMDIFDYIYTNKIVRNLIRSGDIEKVVEFMQGYDAALEHIESLLKIDKIKVAGGLLTSKYKKELKKQLEHE